MSESKTTADRIEAIAHALHELDCIDAHIERKRAGQPKVEKWADPWLPSGLHQLRKLRQQAAVIDAHLREKGL